jgi:SRSO17 transposase
MNAILVPPLATMDRLVHLDEYLVRYRDLFNRADQARSFGLYVRGLLDGDHRKNVESIAGQVRGAAGPATDLAQSLQHFVTQSPWDADRVVTRYRSLAVPNPPSRTWVVHDGVIPKKGRYSVGVQRQFARSLGKKVNCQVAVVVSDVTRRCVPLAARLYLPAYWLREHHTRALRTVPESFRRIRSKVQVALDLIEELASDGRPDQVFAEDGYTSVADFCDGLSRLSIRLGDSRTEAETSLGAALNCFEQLKDVLGLSHFEGRTWIGWHHHLALVLAAHGFLVCRGKFDPDSRNTLPSLPMN